MVPKTSLHRKNPFGADLYIAKKSYSSTELKGDNSEGFAIPRPSKFEIGVWELAGDGCSLPG